MAIRVWLKKSALECFRVTKRKRADQGETLMLDGVDLRCEGGCYYLEIPDISKEVPEFVKPFIDSISIGVYGTWMPRREQGIYAQDGVEGEVIIHAGGTQEIKVYGTKEIAKAQSLLDNIREGKIRPVRSFDGPQNGLSAVAANKEVVRLQTEIEGYKSQIKYLESEDSRKDQEIMKLMNPWWRRLNKWVWGG